MGRLLDLLFGREDDEDEAETQTAKTPPKGKHDRKLKNKISVVEYFRGEYRTIEADIWMKYHIKLPMRLQDVLQNPVKDYGKLPISHELAMDIAAGLLDLEQQGRSIDHYCGYIVVEHEGKERLLHVKNDEDGSLKLACFNAYMQRFDNANPAAGQLPGRIRRAPRRSCPDVLLIDTSNKNERMIVDDGTIS